MQSGYEATLNWGRSISELAEKSTDTFGGDGDGSADDYVATSAVEEEDPSLVARGSYLAATDTKPATEHADPEQPAQSVKSVFGFDNDDDEDEDDEIVDGFGFLEDEGKTLNV